MAQAVQVALIASQTWPQGDIRDPLGTWGMRNRIVGDGGGGSVKTTVITPLDQDAAYVYNVEALTCAIVDVVQIVNTFAKGRVLTNWPNIDPQVGVQGFGTVRVDGIAGSGNFTEPVAAGSSNGGQIYQPNDRYLLCYDPRPTAGAIAIVELEISDNILNTDYSFEAYGYFWDRSVLQAPGGPRFPGSS